MIRRFIGLALCAALLPAFPVGADVTVGFIPPDSSSVQDTLSVQVYVDAQASDLRGFSMVVGFDPTLVQFLSVDAGSLLAGAGCPHFLNWLNEAQVAAGDSVLAYDGAGLGCSLVGPGNIVEFDFVCVSVGSSPLTCQYVEFRDSMNNSIATVCVDGVITCDEPISVEGATWGRMKARYRDGREPLR